MIINKLIKKIILTFPFVKKLQSQVTNFNKNSMYPAGHFYSPIVAVDEIKKRENEIWNQKSDNKINGINLETEKQIQLVKNFKIWYDQLPFSENTTKGLRYFFNNEYYSYTDGIMLYAMMREFKPKRIIEIGSGFSSAVMLDTNDLFFDSKIQLTFIDPYADRLFSLISEEDQKSATVIQTDVQEIPLTLFENLEAGDILFIDSTHVVKTGSDVNYILFSILPVLKSGVILHFHDIFYPFEYPKEWVFKGFNWNESYVLKAFLMYNTAFEILLFSDYLHQHHKEVFLNLPDCTKNTGGNLWIRKK